MICLLVVAQFMAVVITSRQITKVIPDPPAELGHSDGFYLTADEYPTILQPCKKSVHRSGRLSV